MAERAKTGIEQEPAETRACCGDLGLARSWVRVSSERPSRVLPPLHIRFTIQRLADRNAYARIGRLIPEHVHRGAAHAHAGVTSGAIDERRDDVDAKGIVLAPLTTE